MNKYAKLIANTLLFAVGTFSSKVLVFLLVPLYTHVLTKAEVGTADLIVQMSNLMLPLVTVGILNSIIRYGLDKSIHKSDVFTTGLLVISCGFVVFLLLAPLISRVEYFLQHTMLIYLYVLMSSIRSLFSQFVRAKEYVRLYAMDGVLATLLVIAFNLLFLLVFRWGIIGYVAATIVADFCSALFLFVIARLWKYVHFRKGMKAVSLEMLRYAAPLIPTTVSWWVTNMSSRYIVTYKLSADYNGLYSIAYRIPTVVTLIANIFIDAWQMSAITEGQSSAKERADFFTKVFGAFQAIVFVSASGLILFSKVIMQILVMGSPDFYPAWKYVPLLILATSFSCMVSFLGSVYMVEKRSSLALFTTLTGAGINVALCFLFVEPLGVNGAALAMAISYFVVFIMRGVSATHMVHMHWNIPKLVLNIALVTVQCYLMVQEVPWWILWEMLLTGICMAINLRPILRQLRRLLTGRRKSA